MSDILLRIRKLLALSKSSNEHEAAVAAERARTLMAEHSLVEAELRVEDSTLKAEAIVDHVRLDADAERPGARSAWKIVIALATAKSLGCHPYESRKEIVVFGRESATQAWRYTTQYLFAEIERLTGEAWDREGDGNAKAWRNAFKMGAAITISTRLKETTEVAIREREATRAPETEEKALTIVKQDQAEVDAAYAARSARFRATRSIGTASRRDAYEAGREAGAAVALGGGGRGLAAGQGRLK